MTTQLITAPASSSVAKALATMQRHHLRRLLLTDDQGGFQGIVVRSACLACSDQRQSVSRLMPAQTSTCRPHMPLGTVGMFMRRHRIGGLPVLDDYQHLCGIITESDVLQALASVTHWDQAAAHVLLRLTDWQENLLPWLIQFAEGLDVQFIHVLPHQTQQGEWQVSMRLRGEAITTYLDLLRETGTQVLWYDQVPGRPATI